MWIMEPPYEKVLILTCNINAKNQDCNVVESTIMMRLNCLNISKDNDKVRKNLAQNCHRSNLEMTKSDMSSHMLYSL
jgi:chaperonin GroEL (HSP60 family)